jgi:hypothetical protein
MKIKMAETIQEWHVVDPEPETMSDEDIYEVEETILVIWEGDDPLAAMALVADTWPPPPLSQPEWQHDTSQLHSIPLEMIPIPLEHRELSFQVDKFTAPAAIARPSVMAKSATLSTVGAKGYAAAPPKLWKPWETSSSESGDNSTMSKGSVSSFSIDCDREEEVVPQNVVGQDFQQEYDLWLKSNSSLSMGVAGVGTWAGAEEPRNRDVGEGPGSNLTMVESDRSDMLMLDLAYLSSLFQE